MDIDESEKKIQTEKSRKVVQAMCDALNGHVIDGMEEYWHKDAVWRGPSGAGVKNSLKEFQDGWQRPFLKAFPDKSGTVDIKIAEGEYVAWTGDVEAEHHGEFLGLKGDGRKVKLRYMDFWKVKDGKIIENWVMLDIIAFFKQYGIDLLKGDGWDDRK